MMCDSVVLPSPGGPNSSTWSSASSRLLRRADEDLQLLAHLGLADVLVEQLGPQRALDGLLLGRNGRGGHHALGRRGQEIVGLDGHGPDYFASAFSASLMPSLTPTSFGSALSASAASLSL